MKTLVKNLHPWYCSEVVEHSYGEMKLSAAKFKIECKNGGGNCHLKIYTISTNGLGEIANEYDIPDYARIDGGSDDVRLRLGAQNLKAAESWIKKVFK